MGVSAQIITIIQDAKPAGTFNVSEKNIEVSPNQAKNILYIRSPIDKILITIYDINGRMVMNE